jgi:glycosyltransferase involved in cell wall biosynthesis
LELRSAEGAGGGPEKTILLGASCADPRRLAVTVCYLRPSRDESFDVDRRARELGLDFVEVRQTCRLDPALYPAVRRLIREREIDIVHAHDYKSNLLALLLARGEGVVPLSTAHGWTGRSRRERWLYYPVDKWLLRRFPRVIAVSTPIRAELLQAGLAPARVRTILNGIDHNTYRRDAASVRAARAELGLAPGEVAIGAVGRLSVQKRFDVLLQAFATLLHDYRPARLFVAGDGELRGWLAAKAGRLGVGTACRFLGHVRDVVRFHHGLDLFVQSSDYEGTPNVVLEAMAMETPIVATNVGGTGELMEDGVHGLLAAPGEPAALCERMRQVLADPEATARRTHLARARVETELSFRARTTAVEAIYEELVAQRDGRRPTQEPCNR